MLLRINEQEFSLFRDFIEDACGIVLGEEKAYLIENRLSSLVQKSGCKSYGEFYLKLNHSPITDPLRTSVIDAITTHETLWFRDEYPFRIFRERLLPEFQQAIRENRRGAIHIWSAACSTGQEPYSIAMAISDFCRDSVCERRPCQDNARILATDISPVVLSQAIAGQYDVSAMSRGLSSEHRNRYFRKEGEQWVLLPEIRQMVAFRQFNLKDPVVGIIGPFDIIFLRNVIIYFSEALKKTLFARAARLLNPGGYMFLGSGETVGGYTNAFEMLEHRGTIFYRMKD